MSLSDVHAFVTSCARYSAARLASISLAGVDVIDPYPETWLELLGRLAEDVSFSPGVPPTSADAPRRMWRDGFENLEIFFSPVGVSLTRKAICGLLNEVETSAPVALKNRISIRGKDCLQVGQITFSQHPVETLEDFSIDYQRNFR